MGSLLSYQKGILVDINDKIIDGLSDEMRAKIAGCERPEDFLALAQDEGVELSDEQMEAVSAGSWDCFDCPDYSCKISGGYRG